MIKDYNIDKYVNLKSYSDSVGWVGFYCRKCNYSHKLMSESIYLFVNFFKTFCQDVAVLTSLYKFSDNNILLTEKERDLVKLGYLRDLSMNCQSQEEISMSLNPIFFDNSKWDIIKKLSSLIMNNNGDIAGHCFFLFETLNLIVYPHEDTGYGFILKSPDDFSTQIISDFLLKLDNCKFSYQLKLL